MFEAPLLICFYEKTGEPNSKELENANYCGVYEPELSRYWPNNGNARENEFASSPSYTAWFCGYYKGGFCAIFDKDPFR
jgi:hypothetical protein